MTRLNRTRIIFALCDGCMVIMCALLMALIHGEPIMAKTLRQNLFIFFTFPVIWVVLSLITRKFRLGERTSLWQVFTSVLFSNLAILSAVAILIVLFQFTHYSRVILFGSFASITLCELIIGNLYVSVQRSAFILDWIGLNIPREHHDLKPPPIPEALMESRHLETLRDSIIEEVGLTAFTWIWGIMDIVDPRNLILATDTRFNFINHPEGFYTGLVNLTRINNIRRICKFFLTVNSKLPVGGIFIGCVETYNLRKERILAKFPFGINYMVYTVDFAVHRVMPKLAFTRKLYFLITRGNKRVMSRTEALGRLYYCGFEILEEKSIGGLLYWKTRKTGTPARDDNYTYGIFIHLPRIGRNGKKLNVYKLRTMHAYAEFLQGYMYTHHALAEGGKFREDFRVTTLGRVFRKLWIDELPMFINVLKGEMKIVGVRPLSEQYFNLYSEELQRRRILHKPGLIPPYYAQYPTPKTLAEIQQNEMDYLNAREKHPFTTDMTYFFRAMYNIFWRRARSS